MGSERLHSGKDQDPQFEAIARSLCQRPSMYVTPPSYGAVCGYLDGFDAARDHGPLMGFKEWLVVRVDGGNNLAWSGLVLGLVPNRDDDRLAIAALGSLLSEFFEVRQTRGLTRILHEFDRWLLRQSWYSETLHGRDRPLRTRDDLGPQA